MQKRYSEKKGGKKVGKVTLSASLVTELSLEARQTQAYWDKRWPQPWPLASQLLIEQGLVNDENYRYWTSFFRESLKAYISNEFFLLKELPPGPKIILHASFSRDDSAYMPGAFNEGFRIYIVDVSQASCQDAYKYLQELSARGQKIYADVVTADIEGVLQQTDLATSNVAIIVASRLVQNFARHVKKVTKEQRYKMAHRKLVRVFKPIGRLLRTNCSMRFVLVTMFLEDNPDLRSDAIAFSKKETLAPLQQGAGCKSVKIIRESSEIRFYEKVYRACTIGIGLQT